MQSLEYYISNPSSNDLVVLVGQVLQNGDIFTWEDKQYITEVTMSIRIEQLYNLFELHFHFRIQDILDYVDSNLNVSPFVYVDNQNCIEWTMESPDLVVKILEAFKYYNELIL
jgi:hypothetical protein